MAPTGLKMVLIAVLAAMLMWMGALAQSSSCTSALIGLSPCLNYITGNDSTPSSSCCSQLSSVVQSEPQCLCTVLNGGASSLGFTINQTQALALPSACNVQTPPVSRCNASGGPTASPSTPSVPSGSGSNTVPTAGTGSSDGSSASVPLLLVFSLLFVAASSSTHLTVL